MPLYGRHYTGATAVILDVGAAAAAVDVDVDVFHGGTTRRNHDEGYALAWVVPRLIKPKP